MFLGSVCLFLDVIFIYILPVFSALEDEANAFDNKSSSTIKLNNGTVLYLKEVNRCLALVCILREESFDKQGELAV